MENPENIHTSNTMQTDQVIFSNIYVYTYVYMNITKIIEKRCHEFDREQRLAYGRVRRNEKEGEDDVIIISKII